MAFFTLEAPGLTIFPNHRLVHNVEGFDLDALVGAARRWFEVAPLPDPLDFRPANPPPRAIGRRAAPALPPCAAAPLPRPHDDRPANRAAGLLVPQAGGTVDIRTP